MSGGSMVIDLRELNEAITHARQATLKARTFEQRKACEDYCNELLEQRHALAQGPQVLLLALVGPQSTHR